MTHKPSRTAIAAVFGLSLALGGQAALASGGQPLGDETRAQANEKLQAEGYEVRKITMEDGKIEAYVLKNGMRMEIYLDRDLNVINSKSDD